MKPLPTSSNFVSVNLGIIRRINGDERVNNVKILYNICEVKMLRQYFVTQV